MTDRSIKIILGTSAVTGRLEVDGGMDVAVAGPLTVEDRLLIRELYARYVWAMDSGDLDAFVDCYAPGGRLDVGRSATTPEEIRNWLADFLKDSAFPGSQHHYNQFVMEGDGRSCQVRAYWVRLYRLPGTTSSQIIAQGYYTDTVVKVDGRWRFLIKRSHPAHELREHKFGQEPAPTPPVGEDSLYDVGAPLF